MDMVQGGDHNCIFGQFIAPRQNQVDLSSASGLERRVVSTLSFFDVLVKKIQTFGDLGSHLGIFIDSVVDELLEQLLLHTWVGDEAVD